MGTSVLDKLYNKKERKTEMFKIRMLCVDIINEAEEAKRKYHIDSNTYNQVRETMWKVYAKLI